MVPVVLVGVFPAIVAVLMWRGIQTEPSDLPAHRNPAELKTALTFGILYSVVLILIAAAREYFGERELFLVAAISGLADVDAATLSTAQLVEAHKLQPDLAWRMIVTVLLANTLSKAGLAFLLGGRRLFGRILLPFGVSVLVGLLVLVMY